MSNQPNRDLTVALSKVEILADDPPVVWFTRNNEAGIGLAWWCDMWSSPPVQKRSAWGTWWESAPGKDALIGRFYNDAVIKRCGTYPETERECLRVPVK